jgi:hypothetical protein
VLVAVDSGAGSVADDAGGGGGGDSRRSRTRSRTAIDASTTSSTRR